VRVAERRLTALPVSTRSYEHGEGIRWDAAREQLLWVDITAGRFLRAAPGQLDQPRVHEAGMPVGAVTPRVSGGWVLAAGRGFVLLHEDGTQQVLAEVEPPDVRMNDGACDPQGRFWAGSMAYDARPGAATLHVLDPDGSVRPALPGLTISNGIGWSPDGGTCYLNDSGPGVTYAFDVRDGGAQLTGQRVLITHDGGVGDGMVLDDEGFLWVPLWGGSAVVRYDPAGRVSARVEVDAVQPTCCALVGQTLYITSASKGLRSPRPGDGRIFAVDVGVGGPPVQACELA